MWWRITRREFESNGNAGNRRAIRRIVKNGESPGILAYDDGQPIAWCSVGPRESFGSLERSRVLKRIDDEPVWSIVCFFVARSHRGRAVIDELVEGAARWAAANGVRTLEAYPTAPRGNRLEAVSSFMGIPDVLERCGFEEVARPSAAKIVMRRALR